MLDDPQILFAARVCGVSLSLLIVIFMAKEVWSRIQARQMDLATYLALAILGLSVGASIWLGWGAAYYFTVATGRPAHWMISSAFIPSSVSILMISAVALIRALALSSQAALMCLVPVALTTIGAYFWIGTYLP